VWASNDLIVYARPLAEPAPIARPRIQVLESTDSRLPGDAFFRNERRSGLAVLDLQTGRERTLVNDGGRLRRFDVAPDGRHALVNATGSEGGNEVFLWPIGRRAEPLRLEDGAQRAAWLPDGRLFWRSESGLVARSPDASEEDVLVEALGDIIGNVTWAPDGAHFASLVADPSLTDPEIETPEPGMYTIARPFTDLQVRAVGNEAAVNLTSDFTDNVRSPVWSADGSSLFFVATDNATYDETLYRYDVATERLSVLSEGRESYGTLTPVPGGLLVSKQSATAPPDLWRVDAETGAWTRVTELNPGLSAFAFSEPDLFHFDNEDGDRLGALLYKPVGATQDVPVVTYVYEKLTPGIHRFSARQQIFATHGYAVLMPNVKVKVGETGTSFVKSVVPAVEAVRAMGFTNDRFCLWGGSFGAYATSFVITQTTVFDCAVSRATPPELFRNWASGRDRDSDNIESGQARMGDSPFEVMERYLAQSAFFHLDQVETPVLLMHGVKDYTILFEEGAMMFYALRRLEKEATFVAYREGDHSLYRHSRADALDVHQRMLDWFEKYLRR
jgi:dipeptidyl aminopeptidase/acylaminoacyl peptidase